MPRKDIPKGHISRAHESMPGGDFSRDEGRSLPEGHLAFLDVSVEKVVSTTDPIPRAVLDPTPDGGYSATELLGFPGAHY